MNSQDQGMRHHRIHHHPLPPWMRWRWRWWSPECHEQPYKQMQNRKDRERTHKVNRSCRDGDFRWSLTRCFPPTTPVSGGSSSGSNNEWGGGVSTVVSLSLGWTAREVVAVMCSSVLKEKPGSKTRMEGGWDWWCAPVRAPNRRRWWRSFLTATIAPQQQPKRGGWSCDRRTRKEENGGGQYHPELERGRKESPEWSWIAGWRRSRRGFLAVAI